jgi:hypothetical protein
MRINLFILTTFLVVVTTIFLVACGGPTTNGDEDTNNINPPLCTDEITEDCITQCEPQCDGAICGADDGCRGTCPGTCDEVEAVCLETELDLNDWHCEVQEPECDCPHGWECVEGECVEHLDPCENLYEIDGRWRNATDVSRELFVSLNNFKSIDGECIVSVSGNGSYFEGEVSGTELPLEITVMVATIQTYTEGEYLVQYVTINGEPEAEIYFRR